MIWCTYLAKRGQSVGFTKPRSTSPQRQPAGSLDISLFTGIIFKASNSLKASVKSNPEFSITPKPRQLADAFYILNP